MDYIDVKVKNSIAFADTAECICAIREMVGDELLVKVDYSVEPPVMIVGKAEVNVGDFVCVDEKGNVFIAPQKHCDE